MAFRPNQAHFISLYNDKYRPKFNEDLFVRDNMEICNELRNVIMSCERNSSFVIQVKSFTVIEDYKEINDIMNNYNETLYKGKRKKKENTFAYVNLKDSDIMLIVVEYYIAIKEEADIITVYIQVPRVVDKYYLKISGNYYSAMYQIVDGSTYNKVTSTSAKKACVALRTIFMPIRIYRNMYDITSTRKDELVSTVYTARIFDKSFSAVKYLLAKYGLYGAFDFLKINCIQITDQDINDDDYYTFNNRTIYISVPKMVYNSNPLVQSFTHTLYHSITKDCTFERIFTRDYWLENLGGEFNKYDVDKGKSVLESVEGIYDISTRRSLRLPDEDKETVYHAIRWMIREFNELNNRDNLDLSTKRIRYGEYIASLYAMKLSKGIYRIAHMGNKAKLDTIKKSIMIQPDFLLGAITKCKLINYRNLVNDLDCITALECTYKGISGIGEKGNSSVPATMRSVQPSQLGRLDLDSSPKSDPGMSGILTPMVKLYDGYFSDYQEPNQWEQDFVQLMNEYKSLQGLKETVTFKKEILGIEDTEYEEYLDECIDTMNKLICPVEFVTRSEEYSDESFITIN